MVLTLTIFVDRHENVLVFVLRDSFNDYEGVNVTFNKWEFSPERDTVTKQFTLQSHTRLKKY